MKRTKAILIALLAMALLLGSVVPASAAQHVSISDLSANPPERWTQTYETKWRTVEIDVLPAVPDVAEMPVLKVAIDFWLADTSLLDGDFHSELYDWGTFVITPSNNQEIGDERNRLAKTGKESTSNYYPPFDWNTSYSKYDDFTFGEAMSTLTSVLRIYNQDDDWLYENPTLLQVYCLEAKDGKTALQPESHRIEVTQKLQGIPVFGQVLDSVFDVKTGEIRMNRPGNLSFSTDIQGAIEFYGEKVKAMETLDEDVPLSDFSVVKASIENEILAGHIRKIFDVDLGYALYNEPGASFDPNIEWTDLVEYAVPMWRVNCIYVESGKKEMRDYTGTDVPERGTMEYRTLFFNAQTGELVDPHDNHRGCGDYQGFISWDQVGGKEQ